MKFPDELMFVQFPHPGGEHNPRGADEMAWNTGDHARKFLRGSGEYVEDGRVRSGPVVFWGEWEPQSSVTRIPQRKALDPRYLHDPNWQVPAGHGPRQNTDPLVFGDRFLYTNCKQRRNQKLRRLATGSLVLFGATRDGVFVLDTVFVVGDEANHRSWSRSASVRAVVFDPLGCSGADSSAFRTYGCRTYGELPAGPFSFVPCQPYEAGSPGFERPVIELDGWINPRSSRAAKATSASSDELQRLWTDVMHQVEAAGCALGVHLDFPRRIAGSAPSLPADADGCGPSRRTTVKPPC